MVRLTRPGSRPFDGARFAVGFLTRIPVGATSGSPAAAVPWFPVIGAAIGLVQGLALVGAATVSSALLAAVLAVALSTLITGAFHLDGIADMADAFGGGWNRDQRLTILKDSRLGTYGTATVVLVLLIEVAALAELAETDGGRWWRPVAVTVAAHAWSRALAVATMAAAPSAGNGMGADYAADLSPVSVVSALGVGALALGSVAVAGPRSRTIAAVAALVGAIAAAMAVIRLAVVKIGGATGDVLGAVQQVTALTVLACFSMVS